MKRHGFVLALLATVFGCAQDAPTGAIDPEVQPTGEVEVLFGARAAERYFSAIQRGDIAPAAPADAAIEFRPAAELRGADAIISPGNENSRRITFRNERLLDAVVGAAGALRSQMIAARDPREALIRSRVRGNGAVAGAAAEQFRRSRLFVANGRSSAEVPTATGQWTTLRQLSDVRQLTATSHITESEEEPVVCAGIFPSTYQHPSWLVWYRGNSIGLRGSFNVIPYEFNGKNTTGDQWASGIHHVQRFQCIYTWHARITGIPATIVYLHNASFGATTPPEPDDPGYCGGGGGGGGGDDEEDPYAQSCSGGGGGSPELVCQDVYIVIEISYDGGLTWQTFWEGWGTECEYAE